MTERPSMSVRNVANVLRAHAETGDALPAYRLKQLEFTLRAAADKMHMAESSIINLVMFTEQLTGGKP